MENGKAVNEGNIMENNIMTAVSFSLVKYLISFRRLSQSLIIKAMKVLLYGL